MLFDDVIEAAPHMASLAKIVSAAPRYELAYDVVRLLVELADKQNSAMEKSLPLCFLPYPRVWVEYVYEHLMRATIDLTGHDMPTIPEASPPSRVGYLFEQLDKHRIRLSLTWTHKNVSEKHGMFFPKLTQSCMGCFTIDTTPDLQVKKFEDRIRVGPNPHTKTEMALLLALGDADDIAMLHKTMEHDLRGEWKLALGTLILLNSKNLVHYAEAPPRKQPKPQRNGATSHVKQPYHTVDLKLSRVQYNRAMAAGVHRDDLRRHIVVAHLKVRKTGVFLWQAHIRGKVGEVHLPDRKVKV
jgi:hypothetical protein